MLSSMNSREIQIAKNNFKQRISVAIQGDDAMRILPESEWLDEAFFV